MERLPRDALRVSDPVFVRFRIAACGHAVVPRCDVCLRCLRPQRGQLIRRLGLKTQMINTGNGATVPTTCAATCAFTAYSSWTINAGSISSSGATSNFYLVVNKPGFASWSSQTQVATIVGSCSPSVTRVVAYTENSRNWNVTITSAGAVSMQLISGTPPVAGYTLALNNITFTK